MGDELGFFKSGRRTKYAGHPLIPGFCFLQKEGLFSPCREADLFPIVCECPFHPAFFALKRTASRERATRQHPRKQSKEPGFWKLPPSAWPPTEQPALPWETLPPPSGWRQPPSAVISQTLTQSWGKSSASTFTPSRKPSANPRRVAPPPAARRRRQRDRPSSTTPNPERSTAAQ